MNFDRPTLLQDETPVVLSIIVGPWARADLGSYSVCYSVERDRCHGHLNCRFCYYYRTDSSFTNARSCSAKVVLFRIPHLFNTGTARWVKCRQRESRSLGFRWILRRG
jgi:hypothetical protein